VDSGGGLHEYWGELKDGNMVFMPIPFAHEPCASSGAMHFKPLAFLCWFIQVAFTEGGQSLIDSAAINSEGNLLNAVSEPFHIIGFVEWRWIGAIHFLPHFLKLRRTHFW
jgi:hypothetical protein